MQAAADGPSCLPAAAACTASQSSGGWGLGLGWQQITSEGLIVQPALACLITGWLLTKSVVCRATPPQCRWGGMKLL